MGRSDEQIIQGGLAPVARELDAGDVAYDELRCDEPDEWG
jgi:hypothetical protein